MWPFLAPFSPLTWEKALPLTLPLTLVLPPPATCDLRPPRSWAASALVLAPQSSAPLPLRLECLWGGLGRGPRLALAAAAAAAAAAAEEEEEEGEERASLAGGLPRRRSAAPCWESRLVLEPVLSLPLRSASSCGSWLQQATRL